MRELEKVLRTVENGDTLEVVHNGNIYHFTRCSKRLAGFTVMVNGFIYESRPIFQPKIIVSWLEKDMFLK